MSCVQYSTRVLVVRVQYSTLHKVKIHKMYRVPGTGTPCNVCVCSSVGLSQGECRSRERGRLAEPILSTAPRGRGFVGYGGSGCSVSAEFTSAPRSLEQQSPSSESDSETASTSKGNRRRVPLRIQRMSSLKKAQAVLHGLQGHANNVQKGTRAVIKGVGKGVSLFADTSKAMLGDLKLKSLQALIPALLQDVQDGNLEGVKHLIALSQDKRNTTELDNIRDLEGRNVLHKAAAGGHANIIQLLLDAIKLNQTQRDAATDAPSPKQLQVSLINAKDHYGNTPLTTLCMSGTQAVKFSTRLRRMSSRSLEKERSRSTNLLLGARVLRSEGAKMNEVKYITKDTPLHWLAFHGEPDVIFELTDVNHADGLWCMLSRNRQSQFPLDVAGLRYAAVRLSEYKYNSLSLNDSNSWLMVKAKQYEKTMVRCMEAGTRALGYFSEQRNNNKNDAKLAVTKRALIKYTAHWLYWACVIGNMNQVKEALTSENGDNALHTQIDCHGQRTPLHGACRFAHIDVVEFLLKHKETVRRQTSKGVPDESTVTRQHSRTDHYIVGSILKVLDHQRDTVLHTAILASNTACLLQRARKIVKLLVSTALRKNIDLGISLRNQSALTPIDYAKDVVIHETVKIYRERLKERRSSGMLRSVSQNITAVIPEQNTSETSDGRKP